MNISSVEEYIGYTMATQLMKEAIGDGTEYELIYQALLEQMQNNSSASTEKTAEIVSSTSSSMSLDSLPLIRVGDEIEVYGKKSLSYNLSDLSSLGISDSASLNNSVNVGSTYSYSTNESAEMSEIYETVNKYAEMYGVDAELILAVIKAESNFDSTATSGAGAIGLMQVMDFNLEAYGVTNGYDVEENIKTGVSILKNYLDDCDGNVAMALMAYNAGPGTMMNRGVSSVDDLYKMPTETQNYVPKVLAYYEEYKSQ